MKLLCDLFQLPQIFFYQTRLSSTSYAKKKLKDYKFVEIRNEDCEQQYIKGWGPGGQKVNKTNNAVLMRHKPTNVVVKVLYFL